MRTPPSLKPGDTIQIIAPSRWADEELLQKSVAFIDHHGFTPAFSKNILARDGQFAGNDDIRVLDFKEAWGNGEVKAIWSIRGGYGAQRIIDVLQHDLLLEAPKWMIGFSDSTAIHAILNSAGLQSIHGPVLSACEAVAHEDIDELFRILTGEAPHDLRIEPYSLNQYGSCQGRLVGGNLSVLQSMLGTGTMPIQKGDVLFLEDIDEMLYHIDRMMLHLQRAGVLESISGILLGSMTDMRDNTRAYGFSVDNPYGQNPFDIISSHVKKSNIPVAFGLPCGHGNRNYPLILGADVSLSVTSEGTVIRYE